MSEANQNQPPRNMSKDLPKRATSRRVYFVDGFANWGITLGGLLVIVAVLGMITFIASQALPLFFSPDSGVMEIGAKRAAATAHVVEGKTSFVLADPNRRVLLRLDDKGVLHYVNLATGEPYHTEDLVGRYFTKWSIPRPANIRLIDSHISKRARGKYRIPGIPGDISEYHYTLALSSGEVLAGYLSFVARFPNWPIGKEPEVVAKLAQPTDEEFSELHFIPDIAPVEFDLNRGKEGASEELVLGLVEKRPQLGEYRAATVRLSEVRRVGFQPFGVPVVGVHSAMNGYDLEQSLNDDLKPKCLTIVRLEGGKVLAALEETPLPGSGVDDDEDTADVDESVPGGSSTPRRIWDLTNLMPENPRFVLASESLKDVAAISETGVLHRIVLKSNPILQPEGVEFEPMLTQKPLNVFQGEWGDKNGEQWTDTLKDEFGIDAGSDLKVSAFEFLIGDTALLIADSRGGLQQWFQTEMELGQDERHRLGARYFSEVQLDGWRGYRRIRHFEIGTAPIVDINISEKSKSFLVSDTSGHVRGINATAERIFLDFKCDADGPPIVNYSSDLDGVIGYDAKGKLHHWWIDAPHADISFAALFGKVWYEGFSQPEYNYQSTAGSSDSEQKLSLIPLMMGSLKGAIFAMLFSVPLAIAAALYTSEFMSPRLRGIVKPMMEVMAALPSVVLGFLAALWIAPALAPRMTSLVGCVIMIPAAYLLHGWVWQQLPPSFVGKFGHMRSVGLLILLFFVGLFAGSWSGPRVESMLFPRTESANVALVNPKTFEPRADQPLAEDQLAGGEFRAWVAGGSTLAKETSYVVQTPDGSTKVETLPKGWWLPGGGDLFRWLLFLPMVFIVAFVLRAIFVGASVFQRDIHFWKAKPGAFHPITMVNTWKEKLQGQNETRFRQVAVDIGFATGQLLIVAAVTIGVVALVAPILEAIFFSYDHPTAGSVVDFRRALFGADGSKFEQSNSIVVGFAMGFAVIPIIYTISEDSLNTVPNQLRAASLGCGASPWQTAVKVVLPAALPGIFSAVVVGLGRAIGETMIVLMAAGGTPLMSLDPFRGFQSLSGAIATEMPEAAHEGTLYRTLFLAGLLLFAMTFVINTVAETIRIRLRRKLSRV